MKITLEIKGMHCESCEMLISEELLEREGITSAVVSVKDNNAVIEFDENKITVEEIKAIIKEEGFDST